MPVENEQVNGRCVVHIRGSLTIWEAAAAWRDFYRLWCASDPLEIDLSAVESCDGAGIQILCQMHRLLAERPEQGRITGLSEGLRQAVHLAGLDAILLSNVKGEA